MRPSTVSMKKMQNKKPMIGIQSALVSFSPDVVVLAIIQNNSLDDAAVMRVIESV